VKKAVIIFGKFSNNWAVLLPGGKKLQCHNYGTAELYRDMYNRRLLNDL